MKRILPICSAAALLTGCSQASAPAPSETESQVIYDQLYSRTLDDCAFLAFRTGEDEHDSGGWVTADRWVPVLNYHPETDYPEGTFVKIVADVTVLDGGEAGYSGEYEIRKLKDSWEVSYAEALPQCIIPSIDSYATEPARKFETAGSHYLVYRDRTVYRDGVKLGCFSDGTPGHDELSPYYEYPALFDYITDGTLPSLEAHAEILTGGSAAGMPAASDASCALFQIFYDAGFFTDTNVMPLTAAEIAASRESGNYAFIMVPDGDGVPLGDDWLYYKWASVCSETADGALTVTFDGKRSVRLSSDAWELFLHACLPAEYAAGTQ